MPGSIINLFKFVFPSNMVVNIVAGGDDRQLVPNEEYRTANSFLLEFNPNGHKIQVSDSWFGEVEPAPVVGVLSEDLYRFSFEPEFPPSGIDDSAPRVITIKDLSDSDSGINFTYDKTPKFREQETPHVYFDTVKGGSTRTEKRRYTYATADSSVVGYKDEQGVRVNYKKIHDFMSEEDLLNGDKIKFFRISNPENEGAISGEDIKNVASRVPDYPGEALIPGRIDVFVSIDSAYGHIDALSGEGISFPEPGLYISDAADRKDVGLIITVEIPAETNPFSKNVTVKAHTEYTAHINGRIGESSGGLNTLVLNYERPGDGDKAITGATWEEAKSVFLSGKKVVLVNRSNCAECTELGNDSSGEYLYFNAAGVRWNSDGSVVDR